jgi:hypothetical protein
MLRNDAFVKMSPEFGHSLLRMRKAVTLKACLPFLWATFKLLIYLQRDSF